MDLDERVKRFFDLAEARDFKAFREAFAPDARIHQNGARLELDALVAGTESGSRSIRYSARRRIIGEAGAVEQHDVQIVLADGKEVFVRDVCVVLRFDDAGRIVEIDEYVPPQDALASA